MFSFLVRDDHTCSLWLFATALLPLWRRRRIENGKGAAKGAYYQVRSTRANSTATVGTCTCAALAFSITFSSPRTSKCVKAMRAAADEMKQKLLHSWHTSEGDHASSSGALLFFPWHVGKKLSKMRPPLMPSFPREGGGQEGEGGGGAGGFPQGPEAHWLQRVRHI